MIRAALRKAKITSCIVVLGVCGSLAGCAQGAPRPVRDPRRVVLRYEWHGNIDKESFNEPSGIVYDDRRGTLFVVGDEGDICEMTTDGKMLKQKALRRGADFEGLARVPRTGLLYVAIEGEEKILEVSPEDFEPLREFSIPRQFEGVELFKPGGQGIEGICFVPNDKHPHGGTFFVSNQSFSEDPDGEKSLIAEVEVPLRATSEPAEVKIRAWFAPGVIDVAALHYDAQTGHILAASDATNTLMEMTTDGKMLRILALPGADQEGLTLDDEGMMYIAQDSGGIIKIKPLWPEGRR